MRSKIPTILTSLTLLSTLCLCFLAVSCSSGPKGPEPGTPAFYWAAAKQTYSSGDFLKTSDNLDRAMKSADLAPQAAPWLLVLNAGLARGYMELADNFEQGARANRSNPGQFRKQVSDYRRMAKALAMQFAQRFVDFEKANKDEQITLAFPFPSGTQAQPQVVGKIVQGIMPQAADIEDLTRLGLARGVILETSMVVGADEDSTKAAAMFKGGDVKVPRGTFMLAMADMLTDQAELFGPKKLDEPDKLKMFAQEADDALKPLPQDKKTKALAEKLQKLLKPAKK